MFNITFIFIKSINIGTCCNKKVCKIVLQKQNYAENQTKILFDCFFFVTKRKPFVFCKKK